MNENIRETYQFFGGQNWTKHRNKHKKATHSRQPQPHSSHRKSAPKQQFRKGKGKDKGKGKGIKGNHLSFSKKSDFSNTSGKCSHTLWEYFARY